MYALGIPTTRAASLIDSESQVERDKLYTGNVILENCAIVMRVAPSFMRFGSFEIFKKLDMHSGREGPSVGSKNTMLPPMLDYLISNFFTDISNEFDQADASTKKQQYQLMFEQVVKETAELAALW